MKIGYNITRLAVNTLYNIQLKPSDRISPDKMWPDWDSEPEADVSENKEDVIQHLRQSINFLNGIEGS